MLDPSPGCHYSHLGSNRLILATLLGIKSEQSWAWRARVSRACASIDSGSAGNHYTCAQTSMATATATAANDRLQAAGRPGESGRSRMSARPESWPSSPADNDRLQTATGANPVNNDQPITGTQPREAATGLCLGHAETHLCGHGARLALVMTRTPSKTLSVAGDATAATGTQTSGPAALAGFVRVFDC